MLPPFQIVQQDHFPLCNCQLTQGLLQAIARLARDLHDEARDHRRRVRHRADALAAPPGRLGIGADADGAGDGAAAGGRAGAQPAAN